MKRYKITLNSQDRGVHDEGTDAKVAIMDAILECMGKEPHAFLRIEHHRGPFWHVFSNSGYNLVVAEVVHDD